MRDVICAGCRRLSPLSELRIVTDPTSHTKVTRCANCRENLKRIATERTMIRQTILQLAIAGWQVIGVNSDEYVKVSSIKEALDEVFSLDTCTVVVQAVDTKVRHGFMVVLGNGIDCIPDYSFTDDGFSQDMERIQDALYAKYDRP